ncbi:Monothiol glutaredoxin-S15, mitochondrial, variant 2 [Sarracenia purpurea var. burkii]
MWRRLSMQLHHFAAANVSSSPSTLRSRSSVFLFCRTFTFNSGTKASGFFNHHGMQYSTTLPNDPGTHEDFKPTNKFDSSGLSLKDIVEQDVKDNPVMIYMKGVPNLPRCGFSSLAIRILNEYNVPLCARNILEDPELKNAVKAYSNWPTFPQIFINGEFLGGSDIILNMHQVYIFVST